MSSVMSSLYEDYEDYSLGANDKQLCCCADCQYIGVIEVRGREEAICLCDSWEPFWIEDPEKRLHFEDLDCFEGDFIEVIEIEDF